MTSIYPTIDSLIGDDAEIKTIELISDGVIAAIYEDGSQLIFTNTSEGWTMTEGLQIDAATASGMYD